MDSLFNLIYNVALYATAFAGVVAGFKIYNRWQNGQPVVSLIGSWVVSLIVAVAFLKLIKTFVVGGAMMSWSINARAVELAQEMHSFTIVAGVILAIAAVINIYKKYTDGEDVIERIVRWVGSLFFLFSFGLLIEQILS